MRRRGPDAGDAWFSADGRVGLGHRRLAIIDLSPGGAQPMHFGRADDRLQRRDLQLSRAARAAGSARTAHSRRSRTPRCCCSCTTKSRRRCSASCAACSPFALWDGARRRMFLARDPYGIKPLYYADDGGTIRIASQVRALVAGGQVSTAVRSRRRGRLLPARHGAGAVHDVSRHPRACRRVRTRTSTRAASASRCRTSRSPRRCAMPSNATARFTEEQRREIVHDAVLESVRYHMVADVPVGAFLSAGIDSTAVVALARESGATDLQTMTLRFEEYRGRVNDEAPLAAARGAAVRRPPLDSGADARRVPRRAAAHFRGDGPADASMASTAISSARPRTTSA